MLMSVQIIIHSCILLKMASLYKLRFLGWSPVYKAHFPVALLPDNYQSAVFFRASRSIGSFSAASFKTLIILSVLFSTGARVVLRS